MGLKRGEWRTVDVVARADELDRVVADTFVDNFRVPSLFGGQGVICRQASGTSS